MFFIVLFMFHLLAFRRVWRENPAERDRYPYQKEKKKKKEKKQQKASVNTFHSIVMIWQFRAQRKDEKLFVNQSDFRLFYFSFFFSYTLVIQPVKYRGAREVRSNARSEVAAHLLSSARCSARCFAVRGGNGAARIPRKTAMHQRRSFPRMSTREAYKVKDKQRKFPLGAWTRSCLRSIN